MKYDFSTMYDRAGKDSVAFDSLEKFPALPGSEFSIIPMWIADMNFATCPSVVKSMQDRLEHPLFGYFGMRDEYYEKTIRWQEEQNGVTGLTKAHIGYENGVLGGLASAIAAFTVPGEKILINAPAYIGFINTITNAGRQIVYSDLKMDADGVWRMDIADMDKKIKENTIHMVVICSPHNPCGRVWEQEELEALATVLQENDCLAVCDEIWSDIVFEGHKHIPFQSISEDARQRSIALYSIAKTFNTAGIIGAYHVIYNKTLHDKMTAYSKTTHYNAANMLSMYAQIGAYSEEGAEWKNALCQVLKINAEYAVEHIRKHYPGVRVGAPQGTYMLYLDCSEYCSKKGVTLDELYKKGTAVGVLWQDGRPFKLDNTIRMNLALPEKILKEAFSRLDKYVF